MNALAISNSYIGNSDVALSQLLQSTQYLRQALMQNPDSLYLYERLLIMHNNAGNILQSMGELEKSLQMHLAAMRLTDTLLILDPDYPVKQNLQIDILNNTAIVYWHLGKPDKAMAYLQKALVIGQELLDPLSMEMTLNNIGLIQIDQHLFKQAIQTFTEALEFGKQIDDNMGIGGNYNNMGLIYQKLGNLSQSLSYYLKSLQISQRLGYAIGISNTCSNVGKIYGELHQPDSALYYLQWGIAEAQKAGDKTYLLNNYESLYSVYEGNRQFSKALDAYKNYTLVKDSIFNIEKSKQIAEMEAKYNAEKKEKENQILRGNIEIQQRNALLLIMVVATLALLILLLVFFYRMKHKTLKQKTKLFEQEHQLQQLEKSRLEDQLFAEQQINKLQNEKLEQQNRELSTRILHAINKNEAMNTELGIIT